MEVWKDIKGYEGYYQISNFGRVKRLATKVSGKLGSIRSLPERMITPRKQNDYLCVALQNNNRVNIRIHRLVAIHFIPNTKNRLEINHIDGDKKNNNVDNLEWCTRKENVNHAHKIGLVKKRLGEQANFSKLTEKQVIEIKYNTKSMTLKKISLIYGVSPDCIWRIKAGKNWKHV